jgi:hypothetical protein
MDVFAKLDFVTWQHFAPSFFLFCHAAQAITLGFPMASVPLAGFAHQSFGH